MAGKWIDSSRGGFNDVVWLLALSAESDAVGYLGGSWTGGTDYAWKSDPDDENPAESFSAQTHEAIGILHVPKIDRSIGIVEGTDPDALDLGVGHMSSTAFPGQGEQIVLSGHRDTVFRNFAELEIGDEFIVEMPYGDYTYVIRDTMIVDADDTSVVGEMGEEVLVVSTCYPFNYLGSAPERFVFYAYPVSE